MKPIKTYNVGTKSYQMQQHFDGPVILKRDVDYFQMVTFLKASGCDRKKNITPGLKWTFDDDALDMVDEIAGV